MKGKEACSQVGGDPRCGKHGFSGGEWQRFFGILQPTFLMQRCRGAARIGAMNRFLNVRPCLLAAGLLLGCVVDGAAVERDWAQFRGPTGQGLSANDRLPLNWGEDQNLIWKTPVHGRAWSSPIVLDGVVWLTTATEDGRELSVVALDFKTGKVLRDQKLFEVEKPQFAHKFNTYASPTPVGEKGRVYVTFGSPGTACLDAKTGAKIWERRDLECNHFRGAGSSPILYKNWMIMNFDGSDHQFVIALDKRTGKTAWRRERSIDYKDLQPDGKPEADGDWRKAFATPHVAQFGGKPLLISQGAKAVYGYDPDTGREFWRVEERTSHSGGTRPVVTADLILVPSGWSQGQLLAIKPGGTGDVTESHVPWRLKRGIPKKPSLVLAEGLLFMVEDGGLAACVDPATGQELWRERVGGNYSASPIATPGRVYFFNEEGKAVVVAASREFKVLATNTLGDGFMASPAVSGDALILRTKSAVYRIENRK